MFRTVSRGLRAATLSALLCAALLLVAVPVEAAPASVGPSWGGRLLGQLAQWVDDAGLSALWVSSDSGTYPNLDPNGLPTTRPGGPALPANTSDARSGQQGDTLPNLDPNG